MSMTCNITSLMISGCLRPLPCSPSKETPPPFIYANIDQIGLHSCHDAEKELDTNSKDIPIYWKIKTIFCVSRASRIVSASFLPKTESEDSILFVQKIPETMAKIKRMNQEKLGSKDVQDIFKIGFFVPYLSEKEKEEWGVSSPLSHPLKILEEDNLEEMTKNLEKDVKKCVEYFFKDTTTSAICISYINANTINCITEGWSKKT